MGVHTILTQELASEITQLVRDGNYVETAAACCGVSEEAVYQWLRKGREGLDAEGDWPDAYRVFVNAFMQASADAEAEAVRKLREAGEARTLPPDLLEPDGEGGHRVKKGVVYGDWRATAEFLARRYNGRWSSAQKVNLGGQQGNPVQVEHDHGSTAADKLLAFLAGRTEGTAGE